MCIYSLIHTHGPVPAFDHETITSAADTMLRFSSLIPTIPLFRVVSYFVCLWYLGSNSGHCALEAGSTTTEQSLTLLVSCLQKRK